MLTIVIALNGFVFVGELEYGSLVVLRNAYNIRIWGTTNGLGQLAMHGPTKDTKLDPCGIVKIPTHAVIATIDCVLEAWEKATEKKRKVAA